MRALVYHGPGRKAWEEVPDPQITDDGDVIVWVDAVTICGTDPSNIVAIDKSGARLEAAKHFGADVVVDSSGEGPLAAVRDVTGGLGADVAIEAAGLPDAFELAVSLARPGGRIATIGVHGQAATLHLEEQWTRDITITTGLVDTSSTPTLMRLVAGGQIDARRFITHRFALEEFDRAYDVFARAAAAGALKVVLSRPEE